MLNGDPNSRRLSLKDIKAYAKDLDPQMITLFVAGICEAIDDSDSCENDVVLVFEMLARLHGQKIIPNIEKIMSVILRTLSSGAETFESCSKVVSSIALYGIDPLALDKKNTKIILSLCKPLSDALMSFEENASSGAAVCLKGLVNLDVWRFASDEIVNEVCLKVTGALGKALTQTNSHIGLVIALAMHNTWVFEAYVRSIIRSSLKILSERLEANTSQKCLLVIQMINFLMRCVDARSFFSEIESIIEFMEKCQNDQFPSVQDAAFEALQTAKIIAAPGRLRNKLDSNPVTGSDLHRQREEKELWIGSDYGIINHGSPSELPSLGSQSLRYDTFICSAMSSGQSSCNIQGIRHVDKRTWNTDIDSKNGAKKDGFFGHVDLNGNTSTVYFEHCRNCELNEEIQAYRPIQSSNFNSRNLFTESACTNSKRCCSIGDVKTSTSRKLIPSLHSNSNSTVRNVDRPDFHLVRCPSSKDEVCLLPNEVDYRNDLYGRANSDNLKMSKEQQIQDGLLRGAQSPSYDSNALVADSMQTCIGTSLKEGENEQTLKLRKVHASKAAMGQICSISMIFLAIIMLAWLITDDEVLFDDMLPT